MKENLKNVKEEKGESKSVKAAEKKSGKEKPAKGDKMTQLMNFRKKKYGI